MSGFNLSPSDPHNRYYEAMSRLRGRFDIIEKLRTEPHSWVVGETIGAHFRKIIEGIAFGCVIATEHSIKEIPRKVVGQWNAEKIFRALKKEKEFSYPDPNQIRYPTPEEATKFGVKTVIEGVESARISVDDICKIYVRTHPWTHELNPYVSRPPDDEKFVKLIDDVTRVWKMVRLHCIGIRGRRFICTIRDENDGQVKVAPMEMIVE